MGFEELSEKERAKAIAEAVEGHESSGHVMAEAEQRRYYDTDNPDIAKRKKVYASVRDCDGGSDMGAFEAVAKENRFAANEKVASSFFRDITDQKVQYIAGEGADVNPVRDSDADAVAAVFNPLKRQLRRQGQACLTDALVYRCGYAYLQVINGRLRLSYVPYSEVIPSYGLTGELVDVVRHWKRGKREFAEYHTPDKVYAFEKVERQGGTAEWVQTEERWQIQTVTLYGDGTVQASGGKGWSRIPWFEMRHNNDGTSSLTNAVKTMIRCYDIVVSDFANNLIDVQDVFVKLKQGYGSGMEYGETLEMMRLFKASEDVEDVQTVDVPYMARETLLTRLKASIYQALRGVDLERIAAGSTNTATAIRALYSDIDLWADQAEWHMEDWVLDILQTAADYMGVQLPEVNVTFTRRIIFDEVAQMDAVARQKGVISDKTLFENHPLVDDAQAEMERVAAQDLDAAYSVEL